MPIRTSKNWGVLTIAKLVEMGAIKDPDAAKSVGRPPINTLGELEDSKPWRWAIEVHTQVFLANPKYRAQANAIRNICEKDRHATVAAVKQALKRHKNAKGVAEYFAQSRLLAEEIKHRTRDFPEDVLNSMQHWPLTRALQFLRERNIDGRCPPDWAEMVSKPE